MMQETIKPMSEAEFETKCAKLEVKWAIERKENQLKIRMMKYDRIFKDLESLINMI